MSDSDHKHAEHGSHVMIDEAKSRSMDHTRHQEHAEHDLAEHSMHDMHMEPKDHGSQSGHAEHANHTGHEQMFRSRFWGSLLLSIPVLLFSSMVQELLGFRIPAFPGSEWIPFIFSLLIFAYGGIPFLEMAVPEIRNREPGMKTLISLAISVAFVYSLAAQLFILGEGFFWELVTPIDIMLLGHWLEMRSVRQASGALNELVKLMPDTAERVHHGDMTETVPLPALKQGDVEQTPLL